MQNLVSIVTPCYNAASYIKQTIDSVLTQTYTDWELIIVDDCSTDDSAEIIKRYASRDNRIKYLKTDKPSGSPSMPRNIAIDNAKGEYIAFLDADDVWLPDKLEKQVSFMQDNNYSFTYSNYEKMNISGTRNNRVIIMPKVSSFWDVIETCTIPCLTAMLNKDLIGDTRFKNTPKEDFVFWLDILKKGVKAYNVGGILALYRELQNSRSSNKIQMIENQWRVLRTVEGVKAPIAIYFMFKYLYNGMIKFYK